MRENIIPGISGLLHGGDYNPEQWSPDVWLEDMKLMGPAHFDVATVGVFSWAMLEPSEGQYTFEWLDQVMDLLAENSRKAALATPSAAMPAWLSRRSPEVLRVTSEGQRMKHGRRVNFCWTSPIYREKVRQIAQGLAERYKDHPALGFWHVSNEYGGRCHCDLCAEAFRDWLKRKFKNDLKALNQAYWTTYWSHTYYDWDEIEIPNGPYGEDSIMGLTLDWQRFSSDQVIDFYLKESEPLRRATPETPITTNLMGFYPYIDYPKLAKHLDFASWDSYPQFIDHPMAERDWVVSSMSHDMTRALKRKPFLLIESTPDSSNYYPVMMLKRPGMHALEGAQAIAHGSEGVMYFQWRKCRGSSEQYHGAVIGHDGTDQTRVYRDVCETGRNLKAWEGVKGTMPDPEVAIIYDWENSWAIDGSFGPRTEDKNYHRTVVDHYKPFWEAGISVDVVTSEADFETYKIVIGPMLYMLKPGVQQKIREFVKNGGTFVTTYWSAMVDENALNFQGGFPGGLRDVFGIWVEETDCLYNETRVQVQSSRENTVDFSCQFDAHQYCDQIHAEGAEVLATFSSEFYNGKPALTRHEYGEGEAYYVGSRNSDKFHQTFVELLAKRAGIKTPLSQPTPEGVTVQTRTDGETEYVFILNCTQQSQDIDLDEGLTDLSGQSVEGSLKLEAYGFQVLMRPSTFVEAPEKVGMMSR